MSVRVPVGVDKAEVRGGRRIDGAQPPIHRRGSISMMLANLRIAIGIIGVLCLIVLLRFIGIGSCSMHFPF